MASPNQKAGYRDSLQQAAAATTHTLTLYVSRPRRRVYVDRVIASNLTNNTAVCNVYLTSGGMRYHLATLTLTTAAVHYSAQVQAWAVEGERLEFVFTTVTAADMLLAAAIGSAELEE